MKMTQMMFCFLVALLCSTFVGCAHVGTVDQGLTPLSPPQEFKIETVEKEDKVFLRGVITEKLKDLSGKALKAVNDFIDAHAWAEINLNKEILVFTAEKNGFPFFLEGVMRSNPLLNSLPREKERIFVIENAKAPGTKNVYYLVKGSDVPEGKQMVKHWMPGPERFLKHVDPTVNLIEENRTVEWMFIFLFYQGNVDINPELIIPVQGTDNAWNWDRMPHPKDTPKKAMFIPIATMKNGAMEKILM